MDLSIIIPAFNEEKKIATDLVAIRTYLDSTPYSAELLIVDDGSRDATQAVALKKCRELSDEKIHLGILQYGKNRGKGFAIRYGVERAQGRWIAFVDAGLCVPLSFLSKGIELLEAGFDYATATRRHPNAQIVKAQPLYRRWGSQVFWIVVQGFMGVRVSDTQCGFKLFKKEAARKIFSKLKTDGFMFDIETFVVAKRLGFRGTEFPVQWSNDTDTRYHPVWGTIRNFRELIKIRSRDLYGYYS